MLPYLNLCYTFSMLAYRHAFHAGNAADVLKHAVLMFCLEYLTQKDTGFLYADTHAGAGCYDLKGTYADKTQEWYAGIGRLMGADGAEYTLLQSYLSLVRDLPYYPGSPALARRVLRDQDRMVCYEKHLADFAALSAFLSQRRGAEVRNADGFSGLKSLLPPPTRRACVLIDPSYELQDDYKMAEIAVRDALKRFSAGIYLVWYPLLRRGDAGTELRDALMGAYTGRCCVAELVTEDKTKLSDTKRGGLYGSGLLIYNPPWTLKPALEEALPFLAARLSPGIRAPTVFHG